MSKPEIVHKTVLLHEAIDGLNLDGKPVKDLVVVDATFGGGGHTRELCKRHKHVRVVAIDNDASTWTRVHDTFETCNISFHNTNFAELDTALAKEGIEAVDGIIFDLGLSSDQLEASGRGFSFQKDEPLVMTMKVHPTVEDLTAYDVVNEWSEESLAHVIRGYGEERFSKRIAKAIVEARAESPIETTFDLVQIIEHAVPAAYRRGRPHFATRTFQAIRLAVNDELNKLSEGLLKGFSALKAGGRMSVISFHSLEDRIVKRFFIQKEKEGVGKVINKKVIVPSASEVKSNPRARSAKLRIIEKISAQGGSA